MNADQLFLATLDDVRARLASPSEYGLLRMSALLRQLLLDAHPLVDAVNSERRLKITYEVMTADRYVDVIMEDRPIFWSTEDGLDPATAAFGQPVTLRRDAFLARRVMFVDGHAVTVRDVIAQLAHVEGGVHAGSPESAKQEALQQAARVFGIGGLPAGWRLLAAIARVVLRSLEPLEAEVAKG